MRQVSEFLDTAMPRLAKHHIEDITTQVRQYYVKRYVHSKHLKYGNLNKGFTESEVQAFFFAIEDNDEMRLLFEYMATLGFRIGEVVRLNANDINLQTRELRLRSEKSRKLDALIIPKQLFQNTIDYMAKYKDIIKVAQGYLFFSDKQWSKRAEPYIDADYVRKKFREYTKKAGLDEVYDTSTEREGGRATRRLHRLTSHSLRHYAISRFSQRTNGNLVLTSRFARHSNPNTTMIYIHSDKRELYEAIEGIGVSDKQMVNL
ncbi:MAG: site-specific integrase [Candidatus Micrarchaeota archaeon]|nr:site-specific integrase [Candidatus Micrarchaeota archaeon]